MYEGHYIFKVCVHVNVCVNKCWLEDKQKGSKTEEAEFCDIIGSF